ncbi:MAG TPA: ATP-grasp domain-containing protein [Deltaproteobacteria bacterium]|nr:ATP-grasp domain-containing protein [Deltaproteobacteria bacterium]
MKIAITCNIKEEVPPHLEECYAEWDDHETIESVRKALLERHEEVFIVEANRDAPSRLNSLKPDMVFNMAEGMGGDSRESFIPAILELLEIPYTGSSPLTLGLCLNKLRAKQILSCYGIPTPRYFVVEKRYSGIEGGLEFPMIVKPLHEGSSKGIRNDSLVHGEAELEERVNSLIATYGQPALVEEYLSGREFTVALLGNGDDIRVLPIVEIDYSAIPRGANPIYSYEAKWVFDRPEAPLNIFRCPAEVSDTLKENVSRLAVESFKALGVRDWCRVDIRCDAEGRPHVLELNPLPGILPDPEHNSCFPKAARAAGLTFSELVNTVVDIARKRYGL